MTAALTVVPSPHGVAAECPTAGSSIAWTTDPPREAREQTPMEKVAGTRADDGRRWHLYAVPVTTGHGIADPKEG